MRPPRRITKRVEELEAADRRPRPVSVEKAREKLFAALSMAAQQAARGELPPRAGPVVWPSPAHERLAEMLLRRLA